MSTTDTFCLGSGNGMECVDPPRISGAVSDLVGDDADRMEEEAAERVPSKVAGILLPDVLDGPSEFINIVKGSTVAWNCISVKITVQHTQKAKKIAVTAITGCFRRAHLCLVK
jgi:hypothetical protein